MTKLKKMMAMLLTIFTVMSVLAVAAYAANTVDTSYTLTVMLTSDYSHVDTAREKINNTPVYFFAEKSYVNNSNLAGTSAVRVKVYGTTGALNFSSGENRTVSANDLSSIAPYVTCNVGTKYEIHNTVHEYGYGYAYISLANWTDSGITSIVQGVWSPDCAGSYLGAS